MTETVSIQAGTIVSLSAAIPTTFDSEELTGYPSVSATAVGEVVDYSSGGKSYSTTDRVPLSGDTTKYLKAIKSYAQETFTLSRDDDDAGQVIAETAVDAKAEVTVVITNPDGSTDSYTGLVLSFNDARGGAEAMINKTLVIQPTRDTFTVAAA